LLADCCVRSGRPALAGSVGVGCAADFAVAAAASIVVLVVDVVDGVVALDVAVAGVVGGAPPD
jgi:hypothetical protein